MSNIAIHITADGAAAVESEFSAIEKSARRTHSELNNVGSASAGISAFKSQLREARSELEGLRDVAQGVQGIGGKLFLGSAAGAGAMALGLKKSLDVFGEIQSVEMGLESLLGSPEAAKAKIEELKQFALDTPFDFTQTAKSTQQLLAMGFAGEEVTDVLHATGNAVASAGGSTETFQGVLLALGQIKTKGKLVTQELLQMAERGVPAFEILEQELGFTKEQVSEIGHAGLSAEEGIAALLKGMNKIGGGTGMANQMKTIPGQLSTLEDSARETAAAIGEIFSTDATKLISSLNHLVEKTTEFVQKNPQLVKAAAYIGGGTMAAGVLGGGALFVGGGIARGITDIMALSKAYKGSRDAAKLAATAKDGLAASTLRDVAAERTKTGVAGTEARALRDGAKAATTATGSKNALAGATGKAAKGGGLLASAKGFLGKNAFTMPAPQASQHAAHAARLAAAEKNMIQVGAREAATSRELSAARLKYYTAKNAPLAKAGVLERVGLAGRSVSMGSALMGGAAGITAGIGAKNNMQSAGYSEGQSYMYGAATGIGAAGAAMFLPGGAVAVALGEAAAFGINKVYNEKMEHEAENNLASQLADKRTEDGFNELSHQEKAKRYLKEAEIVQKQADREDSGAWWGTSDKHTDATNLRHMARRETLLAKEEPAKKKAEADAAWRRDFEIRTGSGRDWSQTDYVGLDGSRSTSTPAVRKAVENQTAGDFDVQVVVKEKSKPKNSVERDAAQYRRQ